MGVLKVLGGIIGVIVLCIAGVLVAARFADGPWEIIAGGPFTSGERYTGPEPDWSFVRDMDTVEFQLLDPARSRTTWIMEHEGKIYIPCGYMTTTWGKIWKQWPIEAEKDGRAILRIDGILYDRQLVRIQSGPVIEPLLQEIARKYFPPGQAEAAAADATGAADPAETVNSGYLWIFELTPVG